MSIELYPTTRPGRTQRAFTLIELLVVIGIMAILAGLTVSLAKRAADNKKITRVEGELHKWTTLIDIYHERLGVYPPSNPADPSRNPLFYELSGTLFDGTFYTIGNDPNDKLASTDIGIAFGLSGFVNVGTPAEPELAKRMGSVAQADVIVVNGAKMPRVPVDGLGPDGRPNRTNVWYYNSANPVHNPNSYDFWGVYFVGNDLRTNGNWKR